MAFLIYEEAEYYLSVAKLEGEYLGVRVVDGLDEELPEVSVVVLEVLTSDIDDDSQESESLNSGGVWLALGSFGRNADEELVPFVLGQERHGEVGNHNRNDVSHDLYGL